MDICYLCGDGLTDANKHHEHIIQNSIGGILAPDTILCRTCGNELGGEIDTGFVAIFKNIVARLAIKIDRKSNNAARKSSGKIGQVDVIISDNQVVPAKPQHIKIGNKTFVFAPKKSLSEYKNHIKNEYKLSESDIIEITNLTGMGNVEIPFQLDNIAFKRGMAKIAVGFAAYSGISRDHLSDIIDLEERKIKNDIVVVPFVPIASFDKLIERVKPHIWADDYAHHELLLFTYDGVEEAVGKHKRLLLCYIDLFGTFQCYVLLNGDYKEKNVSNDYYQFIFKKQNYDIKSLPDTKNLQLLIREAGISDAEIQELEKRSKDKKALKEICCQC